MRKAGVRYKQVRSVWGKLKLPKQVSHCKACFHYERNFVERGVDTSGVLPEALKRAVKLVTKVAFAEASELLNDWGMPLTKSSLERLSQTYGDTAWEQAQKRFELSEPCSVMKAQQPARRFVIEADGCFVLERDKGASHGREGREVTSLIIYRLNQPRKRVSLSSSVPIDEFRLLAQGLLRQAGIRQGDSCLGLGDGAPWVRQLLGELGAQHSLLDVFHAVSYLATLLQALGFSDAKRLEERKRWLRAEVDGETWLHETQAHDTLTDALRQTWSEAQTAWNYLQTHAQQGALAYPTFKDQGWVIGSGQIEGYNKWAILERMRGSGMHGSKSGLRRMAFLRADFASSKPLTDFHQVRRQAFP